MAQTHQHSKLTERSFVPGFFKVINGKLTVTIPLFTKVSDLSLVMRKPAFCICENKDADQLCDDREAELIRAFVFATLIVQSLYFLNRKFQASSHLPWLYSLVCVGPRRKPRRPVLS